MVVEEADTSGKVAVSGKVSLGYESCASRIGEARSLASIVELGRVVGGGIGEVTLVRSTIVASIVALVGGRTVGESVDVGEASSGSLTLEDAGLSQGGRGEEEGGVQHFDGEG